MALWNIAFCLKLIWMLFFLKDSVWSSWFTKTILAGNLKNLWIINTKQKHSWLRNKLIKVRDRVYPWIKLIVGNGRSCSFWFSNWSPFENINSYLAPMGQRNHHRLGIPTNATLSDLWINGSWVLRPARSEEQVNI